MERAGFRKGLHAAWWVGPSLGEEHFFQSPPTRAGRVHFLAHVRSSDDRSELPNMLQTRLIAGLGELDEQA